MTPEVQLRLSRAKVFLRQAINRDPLSEPESVIDAGYYAMFHAAVAVLIARTGTAPKTHSSVVGRFGALVNHLGEAERLAGKTINRTLDDRLVSHYDPEPEDLQRRAAMIKAEVPEFVELCERLCSSALGPPA